MYSWLQGTQQEFSQLFSLPLQTYSASWWILLVLLSFSTEDSGFFFFAHPGQLSPGVSCTSLRSHIEPRTFHLWFKLCFLSSFCSGGLGRLWNSQYFTRLHHLLFPPYTDALITARLWLTNISPPKTACKLENEVWHEILRIEPWPPSHYLLSILRATVLFPTQFCLVNLQLSISIFFLWWQCLRCDKCWSEKNQSSYLSVTRVPRHPSFKR